MHTDAHRFSNHFCEEKTTAERLGGAGRGRRADPGVDGMDGKRSEIPDGGGTVIGVLLGALLWVLILGCAYLLGHVAAAVWF